MQYYTDLDSYRGDSNTAVTLGKFECMHLGHQKLIKTVREYAEGQNIKSVAIAFDMGQKTVLTNEERREILEPEVDCFIQCPFTSSIRQTKAEDFIREVLAEKLSASCIVTGDDFRFGHKAAGDVSMLKKYEHVYGYKLIVLEKEKYKGRDISTTYVREALESGDIELADRLLGYPYRVSGKVEKGRMLGRRLGFPTVNIAPPQKKLMPRSGVYTCRVMIDGRWYSGVGNVGVKPTVPGDNKVVAEVFLFGYEGIAYGKRAVIEFCAFKRPEIKFDSVEELKRQVDRDIAFGKNYFHLHKECVEGQKENK